MRVPHTEDMDDETFIKHLQARHSEDLAMDFRSLPGRESEPRRLNNPTTWRIYHGILHDWERWSEGQEHDHLQ